MMKRKVVKNIVDKDIKECVAAQQISFYNKSYGNTKLILKSKCSKSDTIDGTAIYYFDGKEETKIKDANTITRIPQATIREYYKTHLIYPIGINENVKKEKLIMFYNKGFLPTDNPLEGAKSWTIWYQVYSDGGVKEDYEEQIIQTGKTFNSMHPLENVFVGKNAMAQGDHTQSSLILKNQKDKKENGKILFPLHMTILDEKEEIYNPYDQRSYQETAVMHGKWNIDGKIEWKRSDIVMVKPEKSVRGLIEPSIIELNDGRILLVMRANNSADGNSGHRWYSISEDSGYTWNKPKPWVYRNGEEFYSPSSCSQLFRHSNRKVYWIGNISRVPTKGNWPRYPLIIGEVDEDTGLLIKESISIIADREEGQSENVTYSNFYAYEDRESGNIKVHVTPFHVVKGKQFSSTAAYVYEISISG